MVPFWDGGHYQFVLLVIDKGNRKANSIENQEWLEKVTKTSVLKFTETTLNVD
jgi:hypothetical protein